MTDNTKMRCLDSGHFMFEQCPRHKVNNENNLSSHFKHVCGEYKEISMFLRPQAG